MNTAIYYQPEGFDTSREKLMGRHAAGEEFLKAWARYSESEHLFCYSRSNEDLKDFLTRTKNDRKPDRKSVWIPWHNWQSLSKPGCLFLPGPNLGPLAYQRRRLGDQSFSICGITHTTASDNVMDALGELLIAPTQSWDALICTSRAVKAMVSSVLESYAEHLQKRFRLSKSFEIPIQLPIIPLGVDTSSFRKSELEKAKLKSDWRNRLHIAQDDFVVLYMGRLSFHAKAHPQPLYLGLERAAERTGKRITLVMAGWFANDSIKDEFIASAKSFCPSVNTIFVDGRKKEVRENIWFMPDTFTSLSDNIQETFGLTPLEAMAAGLPVVASDWDGYRDTVRNGIDGFLVPTWMAGPGCSADIASMNSAGLLSYDHYIGCQSQFTAVDVALTAQAFIQLIESPALRKRMGQAAAERAQNTYEWQIVVKAYEDLFRDLASKRDSKYESSTFDVAEPLRQDPTMLFKAYPSFVLHADTIIRMDENISSSYLTKVTSFSMNTFAIDKLSMKKSVQAVLDNLSMRAPVSAIELRTSLKRLPQTQVDRAVLWLAKMGIVQLVMRDD